MNILENFLTTFPEIQIFLGKLVVLGNLLVVLNATINIFVYCIFSEKYLFLLKLMFKRRPALHGIRAPLLESTAFLRHFVQCQETFL